MGLATTTTTTFSIVVSALYDADRPRSPVVAFREPIGEGVEAQFILRPSVSHVSCSYSVWNRGRKCSDEEFLVPVVYMRCNLGGGSERISCAAAAGLDGLCSTSLRTTCSSMSLSVAVVRI
jgi:hypothetical protein